MSIKMPNRVFLYIIKHWFFYRNQCFPSLILCAGPKFYSNIRNYQIQWSLIHSDLADDETSLSFSDDSCFMRSSLTCVRIWPSWFLPLQVALVFALGLLAESPIPQRQSLGAASTNSVPAVPNKAFFRSAFCENCNKKRCTQGLGINTGVFGYVGS